MVLVETLKVTDNYKKQNRITYIFTYIYLHTYIYLVEIMQNVVLYMSFYVILYPELLLSSLQMFQSMNSIAL